MEQPTIIVTGASQGLGAAIARVAARIGARVVLTARSVSALEIQAQEITQHGGKALVVPGDISHYEDCRRIIDQTVGAFGHIDALVNNAGIIEPLDQIADVDLIQWDQHLAVNLLGPIMMCQLAIPHLRQTTGRVVNITSHAAEIIIPGSSAYSTSKAALNQFSKVLAVEEPSITVILFIPGEVDTPMQAVIRLKAKGKTPDAFYQYFLDLHEKGELLSPEIPAQAAVNLALKAPLEWSGKIIQWDDERISQLT